MENKERMQIIANNITYFRKQKGITQKELAEKIGIQPSTLSDYINLRSAPSFGIIQKLADFFEINKSDIDTTFKEDSPPTSDTARAISDTVERLEEPRRVIVLDTAKMQLDEQNRAQNDVHEELTEYHVFEKLAAGNGYNYMEDRNYDVVFFNKDIDHDFASWVYGDSMEPKFLDGSVALIKDTGWDYDGAIYAVDWDGQSYIKKVYKEKDGLRLVSINDKYDDKFAKWEEEPRIIGKVVGNFMPVER
ncbi:LexA family transcriptional regulator [Streptococcus constellatus]|uniref:LexA family transcriptional regulator n=1 Tax=Streptococcus constellatus TaxID=76860 RepID=UPI0020014BF8|nr:S24 family peptidase [Streptococcus constellatus]